MDLPQSCFLPDCRATVQGDLDQSATPGAKAVGQGSSRFMRSTGSVAVPITGNFPALD